MENMSPEEYRNSKLYRIRHSTAHMMAAAVLEMLCGPEPIVSSWEPAPETCSAYEQSGQYRPQVP